MTRLSLPKDISEFILPHTKKGLYDRMCGILWVLHMVSVNKYTVNCKEIRVEYYFSIFLCLHKWPCVCLSLKLISAYPVRGQELLFVASSWYVSPSLCPSQIRSDPLLPVLCVDIFCVIIVLIGKNWRWDYCFRQSRHLSCIEADFELGYQTVVQGHIFHLKCGWKDKHYESKLICSWLCLVSLCLSGMKSMCLSTYNVTLVVGVALFWEEGHFSL